MLYQYTICIIQEAQTFQTLLEECRSEADLQHVSRTRAATFKTYLKNLFKKKRTAATHVLVIMVAEENRMRKPYALPVQYLPYHSMRDQHMRDILLNLKRVMTEMGMTVVGE